MKKDNDRTTLMMKFKKNMKLMRMKGRYQQNVITIIRKRKMRTTMVMMMTTMLSTTIKGAHFLIAHIMIQMIHTMSLPKKEIKHPLQIEMLGR